MLLKLPNGLLDGADLFNYVEVDELRGKQQNYLVNVELVVNNIGHIPKILEDMILSLQTEQGLKWQGKISELVWKLPASDIETILIKIRENTYGPRFYHEAYCSHCNHLNKNLRLDLDTLEVEYMSVEDMTKAKVVKLPKADVEVELKPLYLKDLFDVIKMTSSKKPESLITTMIATSLKRIGPKSPVSFADVDNISVKDIMFLQDKIKDVKLDGSIDTNIEANCSECGKDFTAKLNLFEPSFFDPTKGSMNTNT
jgi:hypothetical protein